MAVIKVWNIKGVKTQTRAKIVKHAKANRLYIAEVLEEMANKL